MPNLTDAEDAAIGRDLTVIANHLRAAKDGLNRRKENERAVWNQLDLAEARLQAMSMFLSLQPGRSAAEIPSPDSN